MNFIEKLNLATIYLPDIYLTYLPAQSSCAFDKISGFHIVFLTFRCYYVRIGDKNDMYLERKCSTHLIRHVVKEDVQQTLLLVVVTEVGNEVDYL